MGMLLQVAQNAALLKLHIKALESAVDRLVRLDGNVNQGFWIASEGQIMAHVWRFWLRQVQPRALDRSEMGQIPVRQPNSQVHSRA